MAASLTLLQIKCWPGASSRQGTSSKARASMLPFHEPDLTDWSDDACLRGQSRSPGYTSGLPRLTPQWTLGLCSKQLAPIKALSWPDTMARWGLTVHWRWPKASSAGGPWNEQNICCLRGRNDRWFVRRDAGKRAAWHRGSGPLLWARPLRSKSRAIRRFWQLRMGEPAFLGRPWLAGPPGARLRLIRDYGEIGGLMATIDVERRPSKWPGLFDPLGDFGTIRSCVCISIDLTPP